MSHTNSIKYKGCNLGGALLHFYFLEKEAGPNFEKSKPGQNIFWRIEERTFARPPGRKIPTQKKSLDSPHSGLVPCKPNP